MDFFSPFFISAIYLLSEALNGDYLHQLFAQSFIVVNMSDAKLLHIISAREASNFATDGDAVNGKKREDEKMKTK